MAQTQKKEIPLWFEDTDFDKNINRWYKVTESGETVYYNNLYVNPDKDFRLVAEFDSKDLDRYGQWGISWARRSMYEFSHLEINSRKEFRVGYQKGLQYNTIEP